MSTPIDELISPLTVAEATDAIYAAMAARGVDVAVWKSGSPTRTIVACLAIVLAALSSFQAQLAKIGFLAFSAGAWLDLVATYVYGVTREEATFATGTVTLTNALGFLYTLGVGDLVVTNSTTGKSYRNVSGFTLNPTSSLAVDVEALEAGSASDAAAHEIDTMTTVLDGVTVDNAAALVATDDETDEHLRQRSTDKLGSLSPNGPADAYRYVCTTTLRPDGSTIGVTRVRTIADGDGNVSVYVATGSGGIAGGDVTILQAAVDRLAEPQAVTATVISATPSTVAVTLEAWIDSASGLSTGQCVAAIEAALTSWLATRPIGGDQIPGETFGKVYKSALEVQAGAAFVSGVELPTLRISVTVPAADVVMDPDEAPVAGTLAVTVHLVAGGA